MQLFQRIFPIRLLLSVMFLFCFCAENINPTNPYDSDYDGDYRFGITIQPLHDTLQALYPYEVACFDSGSDDFSSWCLSTVPEGNLQPVFGKPSPLRLYFTSAFIGELVVTGVRPNDLTVEYRDSVVVVNPYRIVVDSGSLLGNAQVRFSVVNTRLAATADPLLSVRWKEAPDGSAAVTLPFDSAFTVATERPDSVTIEAVIVDQYDNTLALDPLGVTIPVAAHPTVSIAEESLIASAGRPFTFVASTGHADSLVWRITKSGFDTVTESSALFSYIWNDTIHDTVIVTAKNRFGTIGNSDTVGVIVEKRSLDLELVLFPTTAPAREKTVWKVAATKDDTLLPDEAVTYIWEVFPAAFIDSQEIDNGAMSIVPDDNASEFTITVFAVFGDDTIPGRTVSVRVIADRPIVGLLPSSAEINIGDTVRFIVRAHDTNAQGSVEKIFCRPGKGEPPFTIEEGIVPLAFDIPGMRTVSFWCVDNDDFTSDTVSASLTVTSSAPWFLWHEVDTTVFIGDSFTFVATASAGRDDRSVKTWLWDADSDGGVDFTTAEDRFDTVFTGPGVVSVSVACVDSKDDTSAMPMRFTVTVSEGRPAVVSINPGRSTVYRGDTVTVTVEATDDNGTVDTVYIGTDTLSAIAVPVSSYSEGIARATLRMAMKSVGAIGFFASAKDDDGLVSEWKASEATVQVKEGIPVVVKITPSVAWINDTVSWTVSGYDPDGVIASYIVTWVETEKSYPVYADSVVKMSCATHGEKELSIVAYDNFGNASRALLAKVTIKQGRPHASAEAFPDSVWINDETGYTVSGSDENGVIKRYYAAFGDDGFGSGSTEGTFTHAFIDTGAQEVSCFVTDDDGMASDTLVHTVYVKRGTPSIAAITASKAANAIFINDDVTYKVTAPDVNGSVDSMFVWVDGNGTGSPTFRESVTNDTASITHGFASEGGHTLYIRIRDDDGITKDTAFVVSVRKGTPVIDSIGMNAKIWVRDVNTFSVAARDTNGIVTTFSIDWNNDGTFDGSNSTGIFSHTFDTSESGTGNIRVGIRDNDMVQVEKTFSVSIGLGRPVVRGKTFGDSIQFKSGAAGVDTVFYVNHDNINSSVRIDTVDSNGACVLFYWDWDANGTINATTTTTTTTTTDGFEEGQGRDLIVYCKDDDSLKSNELRLYVYHDAPPPAPLGLGYTVYADSVQIQWDSTALDLKDGVETEVRIMIKYGSSGDPDEVLMDWSVAGELPTIGTKRYYKFEKGYTGDVRYKILLRDRRGSVAESEVAPATIN